MIVIIAALIGAIVGGTLAKKRGGQRLDIIQYTGIYALAFGLLGLIVTLALDRFIF